MLSSPWGDLCSLDLESVTPNPTALEAGPDKGDQAPDVFLVVSVMPVAA